MKVCKNALRQQPIPDKAHDICVPGGDIDEHYTVDKEIKHMDKGIPVPVVKQPERSEWYKRYVARTMAKVRRLKAKKKQSTPMVTERLDEPFTRP